MTKLILGLLATLVLTNAKASGPDPWVDKWEEISNKHSKITIEVNDKNLSCKPYVTSSYQAVLLLNGAGASEAPVHLEGDTREDCAPAATLLAKAQQSSGKLKATLSRHLFKITRTYDGWMDPWHKPGEVVVFERCFVTLVFDDVPAESGLLTSYATTQTPEADPKACIDTPRHPALMMPTASVHKM